MSNPQDFFQDDPFDSPKRPERFSEDYDENLEDCISCGKQYGVHTNRDLIQCALNELRGDRQS